MTREEALQAIKEKMDYYESDKRLRGAIETLIPELSESEDEDERIRKWLIAELKDDYFTDYTPDESKAKAEKAIAWFERQKEASKAIEAVERIDKYIDEHLANAHDMKDSNPDKKYYRGWDDALGEMAVKIRPVIATLLANDEPICIPSVWREESIKKSPSTYSWASLGDDGKFEHGEKYYDADGNEITKEEYEALVRRPTD